ncbi:hypothetical protein L798_04052 [Zootermopsis nevadensis]|uniref:Uncharacterized protein n=1 Tax=Zootermopsis nevadensis TaxID=136037 RepID=A0A067REM3_ZOONE|nr:hypothetical protein L798_04052 [Zootermopsis nevadensis]
MSRLRVQVCATEATRATASLDRRLEDWTPLRPCAHADCLHCLLGCCECLWQDGGG